MNRNILKIQIENLNGVVNSVTEIDRSLLDFVSLVS